MWKNLVLACVFVAYVRANTTDVQQCRGNPGELPSNTYIEGCSSPPCLLPQKEDAVLHISFTAPRDINEMKTSATAYISVGPISLPVPYDLGEQSDTCKYLTSGQCPLVEGQQVEYVLGMHIEDFFPVGTSVAVEFRSEDQSNAPVFCLRVPVRITEPLLASN